MPTVSTIEYQAENEQLVGRLAVPDGSGPFPAVLIAHEGPGHDPIQLDRADRLAALGYVAFALDYHGTASPFKDRDAMVARLDEFRGNPRRMQSFAQAGLDQLLSCTAADPDRVAAIGHCFGASIVLELARGGVALEAVVGFHPGLPTRRPEASQNIRGKVRMFIGADDPIISTEHRLDFEEEMRAAGVDWAMHLYGGVGHSFTHPHADRAKVEGIRYDEAADSHSWESMLRLFAETIG